MFNSRTGLFPRWIPALGLAAGVLSAQAQFQLIENFQTAKPGDLNGQNGWTATPAVVLVEADPVKAGNQVASFWAGAASGYLPVSIPQGTTATLFFRAFSVEDTSGLDWFAGMSDMAISGTGAFGDFEAQLGVAGAQALDTLKVRDGSTGGNVNSAEFLLQTWYKFWVVIDNAADQYEVYMQGGSLTDQTQVDRDDNGNTSYVFRNSGAGPVGNNLIRFFALTSTAHFLPMLLDDIYLAPGKNLNDPTTATTPPPLSVRINSPSDGARFAGGADIAIDASASGGGGTISKVEFFAGASLIGTATSSPYKVTWSKAPAGEQVLTAKVTDSAGASATSAAVKVNVILAQTGSFVLIDNFQGAKLGDLNSQNGWTATLAQLKADPANAANQVASFEGAGDHGANRPVSVPNGATATLFFRFYSEAGDPALRDWWAGLSDVAVTGVGAFGDFEVQIGLTGGAEPLRVRDGTTGAAGNVDVDEFLPRTWYKIWAVIDNAADTYEVYVQGGSLAAQTQVDRDSNGTTAFVFRNSGAGPVANELIRFFVKAGTTTRPGPVLLDDIYLASGKNLSDPTAGGAPQRLTISRQGSEISLSWQGNASLQSSAQADMGYTDVAGAQSPFKINIAAGSQRFYRLRQ
ncbi:MAG: Ig-like domain-containing protein [Verrucomicrobia bacterium]|nr:Ig-like domain-containing protein [Verrucomicrobiota bacterium]